MNIKSLKLSSLTGASKEQTQRASLELKRISLCVAAVQPHLMILLQAPHMGVLPLSSGACCAACRMELRLCIGVGWAGFWCWVTTVLTLSGRKRSAKLGSATHGGRQEGAELFGAAAALVDSAHHKKKKKSHNNPPFEQMSVVTALSVTLLLLY